MNSTTKSRSKSIDRHRNVEANQNNSSNNNINNNSNNNQNNSVYIKQHNLSNVSINKNQQTNINRNTNSSNINQKHDKHDNNSSISDNLNINSNNNSTNLNINNNQHNTSQISNNNYNHNNNNNNISNNFIAHSQDNIRVFIRIRPPLEREIEEISELDIPFRSVAIPSDNNKSCNLVEYLGSELDERNRQREWIENPNLFQLHKFTFDHVFDLNTPQNNVYSIIAKPAIESILQGYNSTIFAYGQTGTGKTYTMEGFTYGNTDGKRGIIPRCIEDIFYYIEQFSDKNSKFMVRASYLQIYNDVISDLLKPEKTNLIIREDKKKGIYVESLSEWAVRSPNDIYTLLQKGSEYRETSATKMNDVSSRSHAVFTIIVEQLCSSGEETGESNNSFTMFSKPGFIPNDLAMTTVKTSKLNLVDLAGSERIRITGATGKQMEEGRKINKSLSALGNVIFALTDYKKRQHIPYRDSKLTRLIEDSLGGNCKTYMIATISPSQESFNESLSTLHFARRAKTIRNKPVINEDKDQRSLIKQYEEELKMLKKQLAKKDNDVLNDEILMNLEQEKMQAQKDKDLALQLLEQTSQKYIEERNEKKILEQKIKTMNSQMIVGGSKIEDTPQFQSALQQRHNIMVKEFDSKLQEIEKEKMSILEDKAQVERYKQLLLKQRDIMIALTGKLNERDEMIQSLQEENEHLEDKYNKLIREVNSDENIGKRVNEYLILDKEDKNNKEKLGGDKDNWRNKKTKDPNDNNYDLNSLVTAEEKVSQLLELNKELEKEVKIMKIVTQRLLCDNKHEDSVIQNTNNTEGNNLNIDPNNHNINNNLNRTLNLKTELFNQAEVEVNYRNQIEGLNKELIDAKSKVEYKDELLSIAKQENEQIQDTLDSYFFKANNYNGDKTKYINKVKDDTETVIKNVLLALEENEAESAKEDLIYLLKYITTQMKSSSFPNILDSYSNNNIQSNNNQLYVNSSNINTKTNKEISINKNASNTLNSFKDIDKNNSQIINNKNNQANYINENITYKENISNSQTSLNNNNNVNSKFINNKSNTDDMNIPLSNNNINHINNNTRSNLDNLPHKVYNIDYLIEKTKINKNSSSTTPSNINKNKQSFYSNVSHNTSNTVNMGNAVNNVDKFINIKLENSKNSLNSNNINHNNHNNLNNYDLNNTSSMSGVSILNNMTNNSHIANLNHNDNNSNLNSNMKYNFKQINLGNTINSNPHNPYLDNYNQNSNINNNNHSNASSSLFQANINQNIGNPYLYSKSNSTSSVVNNKHLEGFVNNTNSNNIQSNRNNSSLINSNNNKYSNESSYNNNNNNNSNNMNKFINKFLSK